MGVVLPVFTDIVKLHQLLNSINTHVFLKVNFHSVSYYTVLYALIVLGVEWRYSLGGRSPPDFVVGSTLSIHPRRVCLVGRGSLYPNRRGSVRLVQDLTWLCVETVDPC